MKTILKRLLLAVLAASLASAATASMLGSPTGPVILSVSGSISEKNDGETAKFDRVMIEQLDWKTVETFTRWTDGPTRFSGIDLASLLEAVGAHGKDIIATALNDYSVKIPMSDAAMHNVLLALEMNGEEMKIRDKGPIWVIYPQSQEQAIQSEFDEKMIWQLRSLEILD